MSKAKGAYVIYFGMAPIFKNAFALLPIQNIRQLLRIKKKKKERKKEISSRDKQLKLEAIDGLTMLTIK